MGFFKNLFERPSRLPKGDEQEEKGRDNLAKIRSLRTEPGYDRYKKEINHRIESGEAKGEYSIEGEDIPNKIDVLERQIEDLESELRDIKDEPEVKRYLDKANDSMEVQSKISELKNRIEESLKSDDKEDLRYKSDLEELDLRKQALEKVNEEAGEMGNNVIEKINQIEEIENEIADKQREVDNLRDIIDSGQKEVRDNLTDGRGNFLN